MVIQSIVVGNLCENCYVVSKGNKCIVIDPGDEENRIIECINNRKVQAILITHYHFDHIGALDSLKKKYNAVVIDYENRCNIDDFDFEIIDTKGHTSDSITFYFKKEGFMFTGDFLFRDSIGRCDFHNSSYNDMKKSIEMIKKYDNNITIYPGHGEITTLKHELQNNVFFNMDK